MAELLSAQEPDELCPAVVIRLMAVGSYPIRLDPLRMEKLVDSVWFHAVVALVVTEMLNLLLGVLLKVTVPRELIRSLLTPWRFHV